MSHQCHSLARVQCSRLNSLTAATTCFSDVTRQQTFPEVDASQGGHLCHWSSKASWVCGQTSTFPGSTACLVCRWTPPPAGLQYWQVGHYGVYGPLPIAVDSSSMTWEMPQPTSSLAFSHSQHAPHSSSSATGSAECLVCRLRPGQQIRLGQTADRLHSLS